MKMKKLYFFFCLLCVLTNGSAQNQLSPVDAGSKVHFVIKNLGIKTGGDFTGLQGMIKFDPNNPTTAAFDVSIDASTIDTDNRTRDRHLKKSEYFDVTGYPRIRMTSTRVQATTKAGRYQFTGNLTIKAVTKPVSFQFTYTATKGGALFVSDVISLNRRTYGVGISSVTLSDDLKLSLSILAK